MSVSASFKDVSPRKTNVRFHCDAQGREEYDECIARWKDEGGYVPPVSHAGTVYTESRSQIER